MAFNTPGGKGSASRPMDVNLKTFDDNFDRIFGKKKPKEEVVKTVPEQSKDNRSRIQPDTDCGCYFCLTVVKGSEITDWIDEGQTALCPRCMLDAVLPNCSDKDYLKEQHKKWFCVKDESGELNDLVVENMPVSEETFQFVTQLIENPPKPEQTLIDALKQQLKEKGTEMTKVKEFITGVGIVAEGKLFQLPKPNRHHHCIELAHRQLGKPITTCTQGFITSTGRYVLREEALKIAKEAGQLLPRHQHKTELFSESVW